MPTRSLRSRPSSSGEDPIREARPAMSVRRRAAALAITAVLCGTAAPAALAAPSPSPSPSAPDLPEGLYGTKDPTYDGVWRQSLAFLAQKIELVTPATKSVDWLVGQQCDSGAFASYRDASRPCDDKTVADTNATAAAVQAVVELGVHREVVDNGVAWLKSVQNDDGGWGYNPGSPSDANSTAVVNGALARRACRSPTSPRRAGRLRTRRCRPSRCPAAARTAGRSPTSRTRRASWPRTRTPRRPRCSARWARAWPRGTTTR